MSTGTVNTVLQVSRSRYEFPIRSYSNVTYWMLLNNENPNHRRSGKWRAMTSSIIATTVLFTGTYSGPLKPPNSFSPLSWIGLKLVFKWHDRWFVILTSIRVDSPFTYCRVITCWICWFIERISIIFISIITSIWNQSRLLLLKSVKSLDSETLFICVAKFFVLPN